MSLPSGGGRNFGYGRIRNAHKVYVAEYFRLFSRKKLQFHQFEQCLKSSYYFAARRVLSEKFVEMHGVLLPERVHYKLLLFLHGERVAHYLFGSGIQRATLRPLEDLTERGVNATIRRELGSDISASCGQLRKKAREITEE